jgi:hypothetical protein
MLNVTVPLTPAYNSAYQQIVIISPRTINLSIDIHEGTHTYTSPFQQVGSLTHFADPRLEAAIRISYSYDAVGEVLELYGNDFESTSNSTCLLSRAANTSDVCQQHTYRSDIRPSGSNLNWTFSDQYSPGLLNALQLSIRGTNDRIVAAARGAFPVVRVNTPPPDLKTAEDMRSWTTMTAMDGTDLGPHDPTREYPEGTNMVNVLESTWGGEVTFSYNEHIANVIGSTPDPKIQNLPWKTLWQDYYGSADECTSHDWASGSKFKCNDSKLANIIGGHVITGKVAKSMPKGSNAVYIIPICKAHNGNDNVYMRTNVYTGGIWLKNYLGK